ncbi:MAG: rfaF [Gammaproteobacteria bacterium]|jgi:heptosyltransferase-2|nr:rfaF [Gammaproteobacteria bacterium]
MADKILVIGPSWVGDMVMAQALFKLLKQQNPEVAIDVLAPEWSRALLERMPEVSKALIMPIGHGQLELKTRYRIGRELRQEGYQQAIIIPNSFKSALIPFWAKIPKRTGWRRELRSILLTDARSLNKKRLPLIVERYLALALPKDTSIPSHWPRPGLEIAYDRLNQVREQYGLMQDQSPILALCPGAEFGPAKRWPAAYYAEVANAFINKGWQVWLLGSPKDSEAAAEIQVLTQQRSRDLTGRTNLANAIDLLSLASLVISNDSGLMHVAAALQRPQIAIYGSTPPEIAPPLNAKSKMLYLNVACSPCFKRECPLVDEHHKCMRELKPAQVLQTAEELLV